MSDPIVVPTDVQNKSQKTGFFEETPGVKSSTRLVFIFGCFWSFVMGSFFAFKGIPPIEIAGFVASVVAVFGGVKATVGALSENKDQKQS
jgi:hypothetical protein